MDTTTTHPTALAHLKVREGASLLLLFGQTVTVARVLAVSTVALFGLVCWQQHELSRRDAEAQTVPPWIVQLDDTGRPTTVSLKPTSATPEDTMRTLLMDFVEQHLSRHRDTLDRDFTRSLSFVHPSLLLTGPLDEPARRKILTTFVRNPGAENQIVVAKSVTFIDLDTPPFRALVDYEQQSYPIGSQTPRTDKGRLMLKFRLHPQVPRTVRRVNPLGLLVERIDEQ